MAVLKLETLRWEGLRNLEDGELRAGGLNVVFGENGAGKTSLLEGIYLLNRGRSFRTTRLEHCVQRDCESMVVYADFETSRGTQRVGVRVYAGSNTTEWRLNGQRPSGLASLANVAPVILITPETLSLVSGTPQLRRQFMDGGMFHVEHQIWDVWRQWRLALRNRNRTLKSGRIDNRHLSAWDDVFVRHSELLTRARQAFVDQLNEQVRRVQHEMSLTLGEITLHFQPGWAKDTRLIDQLVASRVRDVENGYTQLGPHKADLDIRIDGERWAAKRYFSRGQQKMIAIVLELARLNVLKEKTGESGIVLVDDVTAELDHRNQLLLFKGLLNSEAQLFITTLDDEKQALVEAIRENKDHPPARMFHVEHGRVKASVLDID